MLPQPKQRRKQAESAAGAGLGSLARNVTANITTVVTPNLHEITVVIWSAVGNSLMLTKILSRNFLNHGVKKEKASRETEDHLQSHVFSVSLV